MAYNKKIKSLTSFAGTHTCGAASPLYPTCLRPLFKSYTLLNVQKIRIFMKKTIVTIVATFLFGCSSTPNLSTKAIEVQAENLNQHWEMKSQSFSFSSPRNVAKRPDGYVRVRYLIDSNGKVYNPEIVESVPEGVWDDQGLKAVKQMEYEPSQSNTNKIPVYVTTEFHFGNRV